MNHGGETSVSVSLAEDGSVNVSVGTPDIGGSRASIALMTAETYGIPYDSVRVNILETGALGFNEPTHGSRATLASGKAVYEAANQTIAEMCSVSQKSGKLILTLFIGKTDMQNQQDRTREILVLFQ